MRDRESSLEWGSRQDRGNAGSSSFTLSSWLEALSVCSLFFYIFPTVDNRHTFIIRGKLIYPEHQVIGDFF